MVTCDLYAHQPVETAGGLHCGCGRDHGGDHQHHVDRWRCRFETEDKHEDREAYAAHHTETDAAEARTDYDGRENKKQLDQHVFFEY